MDENQEKEFVRWTYLTKGKGYTHLKNWYSQILRDEGREKAEDFKKKVNYVNRRKVL